MEGATDDAYEAILTLGTDPASSDKVITIPSSVTSALMISELTTNDVDAANAVWGGSNQVEFEGASADDYETFLTPTDPTADRTVSLPNASGRLDTLTATVSFSAAQVLTLVTPIDILASQGADTVVEFVSAVLLVDYSGTGNWAEPSAPDELRIQYSSGTDITGDLDATGFIDQTNDEVRLMLPDTTVLAKDTDLVAEKNGSIQLINTGGNYTNNGGTPTSTLDVILTYRVHTLGL
jgi:hypothetical protein